MSPGRNESVERKDRTKHQARAVQKIGRDPERRAEIGVGLVDRKPLSGQFTDIFIAFRDLFILQSVRLGDGQHAQHVGEPGRNRLVLHAVLVILLAHAFAEKLRHKHIDRNDDEEKDGDEPAVVDRDPDRNECDDDVGYEHLEQIDIQGVDALDVLEEFALKFSRLDLLVIGNGQVLQFPYERAAHTRADPPQHLVGNARIDDVRRNILHQNDHQHYGVDDQKAHRIFRHACAGNVDDIGRDDGHDPDRQVFEHKHKEAEKDAPLVSAEKPLVIQASHTLLSGFSVRWRRFFVKQMLEIRNRVVAAIVLFSLIARRIHIFSPCVLPDFFSLGTVIKAPIFYHLSLEKAILFSKIFPGFFHGSRIQKARLRRAFCLYGIGTAERPRKKRPTAQKRL